MSAPASIAFLGFGEAARAFHATLAEANPQLRFSAHDIKLGGAGDAAMRAAMDAAGVRICERPEDLGGAEWIVSAVTADQSLIAARSVLGVLTADTVLVDINSVSPGRKQQTAAEVEARGAAYLDLAVMAPVHPRGHRTPTGAAGHAMDRLAPALDALGFDWTRAGEAPGRATAVKMVRSLFVKGLEALTVECLLAAERSECLPEILGSLARSYPGLGWPEIAAYQFERTLVHGHRRAAEVEEVAVSYDDLGLTGALAAAIAQVQAAMGRAGESVTPGGDLAALIAEVNAARRGE